MAAALIQFAQGATTFTAGEAGEGTTGADVTASNANNTGVTSYAWYIVDVPAGSSLAISQVDATMNPVGAPAATSSTFTFTPDVAGTYQVLLIINGHVITAGDTSGLFDVHDFIVPEEDGSRLPAIWSDRFTFNYSGQTRGTKTDINAQLKRRDFRTVATVSALPSTAINGNATISADDFKFRLYAGGWVSQFYVDDAHVTNSVQFGATGQWLVQTTGTDLEVAALSGAARVSSTALVDLRAPTVRLSNAAYTAFGGLGVDASGNLVSVPYSTSSILGSSVKVMLSDGSAFSFKPFYGLPAPNAGDIPLGISGFGGASWSVLSQPGGAGYVLNSGSGGTPAWSASPTIATGLTISAFGAGFVRSSSGGVFSSSALVAGDIPDISATYATRSALTGTGYIKGAGSFPPSFVASVPVGDLSGVSSWSPTFTGLTLSGLGAGFVRSSSGGALSSSALVAGDIPDISATYATRAALTGTGYLKGAAGFVTFTTTIARADLANAGGAVGDLWYWDGSNMVRLAAVASGSVLASAGTSTAPAYSSSPTLTGLTLSGATASTYATFNGSKALTSQTGVPLADLGNSGGANGDTDYWNGSNWVRLAIGSTGQALTIVGGIPAWGTDFSTQVLITSGSYKQTGVTNASLSVTDKNAQYVIDADLSTTDATATTIYSFTPPSDGVVRLYITIVADKSDGSSGYGCDMLAQYRVSGGTVTSIQDGSPVNVLGTLTPGTISTDTSGGAIRVRVIGIASTTIRWGCFGTIVQRTTAS